MGSPVSSNDIPAGGKDLNACGRRWLSPPRFVAYLGPMIAVTAVKKLGLTPAGLMKALAVILKFSPVLVALSSMVYRIPPFDLTVGGGVGVAAARIFAAPAGNVTPGGHGLITDAVLLGGLIAPEFEEATCLSRYQSSSYRKPSPHQPSPYLLSRLRGYEALHRRCGPHTAAYNRAAEFLFDRSGNWSSPAPDDSGCRYLVWMSFSGLGNRILTLSAAFLYALLTDRVLLVEGGNDVADLFCEPFPGTTWLLPPDILVSGQLFSSLNRESPHSYRNYWGKKKVENGTAALNLPAFVYVHLAHDSDQHDKLFFCDQDVEAPTRKAPWMFLRSDNYFVPSLFLAQPFEQELGKLFPEKETVFHHLGRYVFHPSNRVWGLITRYHEAYLASADERVGIQIRTFEDGGDFGRPIPHVMDQIMACALNENLLPRTHSQDKEPTQIEPPPNGNQNNKSKAVLMTSLISGYFENVKNTYWERATVSGEVVGVFQPSHEEYQQTEKKQHNMKAWAEMYLLSLTDALVTSSWSTFGYVAQGLGGLRPWILVKPENRTVPEPPCRRVMSMEPCFHSPPNYDCRAERAADAGALVPYVKHCEDMSWGIKLFDQQSTS